MKLELYNQIVQDFKKFKGLSRDGAQMLIEKYPEVSRDAIHGIVSSEVQIRTKQSRYKLHSVRINWLTKYRTELKKPGTPPGVIVKLSIDNEFSPTLLARVILEKYLLETNPQTNRADVSKFMKDTTQICDPRLAHEVYLAILFDDRNGLISDVYCNSIGVEYEVKLESYLQERNIPYLTEDKLRLQGYDKTPDVKLELPIAVDGFIINWIESKARFGTPPIHKTHVKEQFLSYWNRFGPGLVIYWFGFVDELIQPGEKKFIVLDHFPENVTYMNPLIEVENSEKNGEKS